MRSGSYRAARTRQKPALAETGLTRRGLLAGSVGAAALIALPAQAFAATRAATRAALPSGTSAATLPRLFIYGIPGPAESPGPSVQAASAPAVSASAASPAAAAAPSLLATQLSAFPSVSPDQRFLALAAVQEPAAAMQVAVTVVDAATAAVVARGTLGLPHVASGSMLLVSPVFAADSATVGLVLSVTVPSDARVISKPDPDTGTMRQVPTATWTSHHELAYFDVATQSFTGPFDLADAPSLARVSAIADDKNLYVWTVAEARPVRAARSAAAFKSQPKIRPVPRLAAYPLGSGRALFSVPTAEPWPVSGEPVTLLPTGEFARLAFGRTVQVYTPTTGAMTEQTIPQLAIATARQGAPFMQVQAGGTVLLANPAAGSAVLADPLSSFRTVSAVRFPPPAYQAGGPANKVALSSDGKTLYVLGSAAAGGLAAYDVATGALAGSYSHGQHYNGLYLIGGDTLVATGGDNPRLTFFSPSLEQLSSLDTELHVTAVF
jgi:hypothetical protein